MPSQRQMVNARDNKPAVLVVDVDDEAQSLHAFESHLLVTTRRQHGREVVHHRA